MLRRLKIFRSGEEELVEALRKHSTLSRAAVNLSMKMLSEPLNLSPSELQELRAKVIELERMGDKIYEEIVSSISRGAFPLFLTADLSVLLDDLDDILDLVYFLGMELSRGIKAGIPKNPIALSIYGSVLKMMEKASEALDLLNVILTYVLSNLPKAAEGVTRIDLIEDAVDEIKNEALENIYSKYRELSTLEFVHLIEIVRAADTVVDKIQDVSQELVRIFSAALS